VIENFHQHPAYLEALAASIEPALLKSNPDLLLLSYHGIPEKQRYKTRNKMDYKIHCEKPQIHYSGYSSSNRKN